MKEKDKEPGAQATDGADPVWGFREDLPEERTFKTTPER